MKKLLSILLAVLFVSSMLSMTAFASNTAQVNQQYVRFVEVSETDEGLTVSAPMQYWSYTHSITNGVVISGKSGTVCTSIETYGNYQSAKISVTSTLEYRNTSGQWVSAGLWSGKGTGYCGFENKVTISPNRMYRVVTSGTTTYNGKTEGISATSKIYYT